MAVLFLQCKEDSGGTAAERRGSDMRFKSIFAAAALLALTGFHAGPASAAVFFVDALSNSSTGGTGLGTMTLNAGQSYSITASATDLWNAGALPRWSNANGLTGPLFATGTDESGQNAGTQIGMNFGLWTQSGFSAPFGALVGQIDSGAYFLIGTSATITPSIAGLLTLYYWDSVASDNTNAIAVNVSAIPEASTWAMMLIGFAGLGFAAYRRRARAAIAAA